MNKCLLKFYVFFNNIPPKRLYSDKRKDSYKSTLSKHKSGLAFQQKLVEKYVLYLL